MLIDDEDEQVDDEFDVLDEIDDEHEHKLVEHELVLDEYDAFDEIHDEQLFDIIEHEEVDEHEVHEALVLIVTIDEFDDNDIIVNIFVQLAIFELDEVEHIFLLLMVLYRLIHDDDGDIIGIDEMLVSIDDDEDELEAVEILDENDVNE